jgi:hypothetical protein
VTAKKGDFGFKILVTIFCIFVIAIFTRIRWYFTVVLICISLIGSVIEHFFISYWLFVGLLLRKPTQITCPLLNQIICVFCYLWECKLE